MAGRISMGARREVLSAVAERYRSAWRREKGRILDELCATTGWHRKHAVRALGRHGTAKVSGAGEPTSRRRTYDATINDAVTALWEASDRVCGKRLVVMIPTLLPALERHGRLRARSHHPCCDDRPNARPDEARGGRRPSPPHGLLFGDPPRGADPDIQ
jgi:hypothetical protein